MIPNGSMLMSIRHNGLNLRVINFLNFLPIALAKVPASFGLTELKKGYFPHLFNIWENQNYVGLIPDSSFYSPDTMSTSGRQMFLAWYDQQKDLVYGSSKGNASWNLKNNC